MNSPKRGDIGKQIGSFYSITQSSILLLSVLEVHTLKLRSNTLKVYIKKLILQQCMRHLQLWKKSTLSVSISLSLYLTAWGLQLLWYPSKVEESRLTRSWGGAYTRYCRMLRSRKIERNFHLISKRVTVAWLDHRRRKFDKVTLSITYHANRAVYK